MKIQRNTWGNVYVLDDMMLLCAHKHCKAHRGAAWIGWQDARQSHANTTRECAAAILREERNKKGGLR